MRYNFNTFYEERFSSIIDTQKYLFKVTLFNPEGDKVTLTKKDVKELKLVDNIRDPWVRGTIALDNTEAALERFVTDPADREFQPDLVPLKGYTYRGDGRDFIQIEIIPINDGPLSEFTNNDKSFQTAFGLRYVFSIKQGNNTTINGDNCKLFNIGDVDEEILKEKKAFFSTGKLATPEGVEAAQSNNEDRYATTGDSIKAILTDNLAGENVINDAEFEAGASKLFYSSPINNTAYDDLNYLLDHHVSDSSSNDFSFLKKSNYTGEYALQSAESIFGKALQKTRNVGGELFTENFTINGIGSGDSGVIEPSKKSPSGSLEFGSKGDVLNHKFFDTDGEQYKKNIKTQVVNSYDFKNKRFNIEVKDSNATAVRDRFSDIYVSPLKGDNNKPYPNLPLTNLQKENQTFESNFSEYGESAEIRKAYGVNKLLKSSLFSNMAIELIIDGQLFRKSGTFFSVDRKGSYIENQYDSKVLGIYLLTEVEHQFIDDNKYIQRIVGVKTNHFSNPNFNESTI
jgi:hypothetical protein